MLTNLSVHAKLAPLTMQTNPLFGYFHAQIRPAHVLYGVADRGVFVRDFAWYFYAGASAQVESPRQPNAD
jgi:hypothetical protein